MEVAVLNLWLAFGAGLLSFVSPCCLPLYPTYISYITGVSVKDLKDGRGMLQSQALLHTLFFIFGFSIVFLGLGLSASLIGDLFTTNRDLIRQLGGIMVFVMGLAMVGVYNPKWMMKDKRVHLKSKPMGYVGSILVGITYAAGWTPCVGPILAAILALGVTQPDQAIFYIIAYTLGFAIPFFIMAYFVGKVKWILKYSSLLMKIGGGMMILTGILLYTDQMTRITIVLIRLYNGFTGF